jgi:hypothetical protein
LVTEETILAFVRSSIRSAWALELLLLLQRNSDQKWTIDELVRELRGSVQLVKENLATLTSADLIARTETDGYSYQPRSAEAADRVAALVELYAQKPVTVLRTIFTSPDDKIRSFSDAFIFRKK